MKVALSEIWNFIELIEQEERGWSYSLHAADVHIENISQDVLLQLKNDEHYDTELLPSIFTFREILWQPDVFTNATMSLPGLRILKAFCEETAEDYAEGENPVEAIYRTLVLGIAGNCEKAISALDGEKKEGTVTRVLGDFRRDSFPILKFFIYHPQNRLDYYRDAVNRLNYAVKIILTQFYGRYTELADPYWVISFDKSDKQVKKSVKKEEKQNSETTSEP